MSVRRWAVILAIVILIAMAAFFLKRKDGERESSFSQEPGSGAQATQSAPSSGPGTITADVRQKLSEIIIPNIDFENTLIEEAIDFLRQRSRELDQGGPETRGLSFVVRLPRAEADERVEPRLDHVTGRLIPSEHSIQRLEAKNVTLLEALDLVCQQSGMAWRIGERAIEIYPGPDPPEARE